MGAAPAWPAMITMNAAMVTRPKLSVFILCVPPETSMRPESLDRLGQDYSRRGAVRQDGRFNDPAKASTGLVPVVPESAPRHRPGLAL